MVSWFDKGEGRVGWRREDCSRKNRGSKREVEQCKWKACFCEEKKKKKKWPKSQKESILAAKNRDYTEAQAQLCPVRDASKEGGGWGDGRRVDVKASGSGSDFWKDGRNQRGAASVLVTAAENPIQRRKRKMTVP